MILSMAFLHHPAQTPSKNRAQSGHWATNVFKYLICVAVSSHSFPFSLHSDCSKPINMPYSNFLHFSKITQQFKRNSVKIRVKMIPFFGNCEQWFPFSAVGNLSVNCRPTGYRHITNTLPTVSRQCSEDQKLTENRVKLFQSKTVNRNMLIASFVPTYLILFKR